MKTLKKSLHHEKKEQDSYEKSSQKVRN